MEHADAPHPLGLLRPRAATRALHRDGRGLGNHLMQQAQPFRLQPRGKMIDAGDVAAGRR
jgi:hypothetical protein